MSRMVSAAAFELHHRGAAFGHQAGRSRQRSGRIAILHEWQVDHLQRACEPPRNQRGVIHHLVQRHWHGAGLPLHDVAERVADQRDIHPGRFHVRGEAGVVASQDHDLLAARLHRAQAGHGHGFAFGCVGRLGVHAGAPGKHWIIAVRLRSAKLRPWCEVRPRVAVLDANDQNS